MISKTISKLPKSVVEVSVSASWVDLEPKWNETLTKLAAEVELPGFRKGQVPLPMVEQNLSNKLQDEFLKTVMPALLVEALQGTNIIPIDYPKYQLTSFTKGGELSFKAQITERPEVKVGDYKNVKVQRPTLKQITDEDVNKLIEELFQRWKARLFANQQTRSGEQTKQSIEAQPPLQQPTANQTSGSISFNQSVLPTQPSGLVDAQGNPLGGAQTLSDVPNDVFAKAVGALSLADLKNKIRTNLENEAKYNNELDYEEAILQEVEKITTVDLPEILIDDELNRMLVSLQRRVADMGLLLEDYLKGQGKTLEGLRAEWRPQAEKNVRMELGLAEIARQEKVEVTDAELQAEIDKVQDAKLKAQFEAQEPRLHLKHSLRQIKTLDLLKTLVKSF